jgi:Fe2+ or Zn2+ uptake regulation protein
MTDPATGTARPGVSVGPTSEFSLFFHVKPGHGDALRGALQALSPSRQWVLAALQAGGDLQTVKQLGDRLAETGRPLKPRTIQTALGELEAAGLATGSEEGNGRARYWSPAPPTTAPAGE